MSTEFKDYYATLGVSREASPDEIKKAFRRLARKHHPDVAMDKASAEEKFKEINEAYEVLGDPEKRRKYDTLGAGWQDAGGFGGAPPPDFGGFPGGGQARPSTECTTCNQRPSVPQVTPTPHQHGHPPRLSND